MGAFYIQTASASISKEVSDHFCELGFRAPECLKAQGVVACFYPKQSFSTINKLENEIGSLYISGTCFYRGKKYRDGLEAVLNDITMDAFNPLLLIGSYFLLFQKKDGKIYFYSDPASVQNIFYHEPSGVISSSYLACLKGAAETSGKLVLNLNAIIEVLTTGILIGPETLIKEIFRYEPVLRNNLPGIERLSTNMIASANLSNGSLEKQVELQLDVLDQYFHDLVPVMDELGVMSGLTGGFDSRLIFLLLRKKTCNYKLYSTSREKPTIEFQCATELANNYDQSILSPPHNRFDKLNTLDFQKRLDENFLFNDGQVRSHQLWTEEIKSKSYSNLIHHSHKIGISGVGGEQYRNGEYLLKNSYSISDWFFYENIFRYVGDPFINRKSRHIFQDHIENKLRHLLGLSANEEHISRFYIKRFNNEVYNPANRVIRNNVENQLYFFLSPFTDFIVSQNAYEAFSQLGTHHKFQKEMILRLAPEVANIPLDYGYNICANVPFRYRMITPVKAFLGLKNYFMLYRLRKKEGKLFASMEENHHFIRKYVDRINDLNLPISVDKIKKSNHLSPLLLEMGVFIEKMQGYFE